MQLLDVECSRLIACEVYRKAGRSTRAHVTESGALSVNRVEESGTAIRAWGEDGGEAFVTLPGHIETMTADLLRRIEPLIGIKGRGCPTLPGPRIAGSMSGSVSIDDAVDEDVAAWLPRFLDELRACFPGCSAWLEAGASIERLWNSNGFDAGQGSQGWHLTLSTVERRAGDRARTRWFSAGGSDLRLPDPDELAARAREMWAVEPWAGTEPGMRLLAGRLNAEFLAALGNLFVPDRDRELPGRPAIGERVAPPGTRIVSCGEPGRFDGEGLPSADVALVEDGLLAGQLVDLNAARDLGLEPTGSGRRDSYRDYPKAGPGVLRIQGRGSAESLAGATMMADGSLWKDETGREVALVGPWAAPVRLGLRSWLADPAGDGSANRVYIRLH